MIHRNTPNRPQVIRAFAAVAHAPAPIPAPAPAPDSKRDDSLTPRPDAREHYDDTTGHEGL